MVSATASFGSEAIVIARHADVDAFLWCPVSPFWLAASAFEVEPNTSATATMTRSLVDIAILLEESDDASKTQRCDQLFLIQAVRMLNHAFLKH
jgi:hypothetical protein